MQYRGSNPPTIFDNIEGGGKGSVSNYFTFNNRYGNSNANLKSQELTKTLERQLHHRQESEDNSDITLTQQSLTNGIDDGNI